MPQSKNQHEHCHDCLQFLNYVIVLWLLDYSALYYKHMTIVNDDSSIISKWSSKLIDDAKGVIYNHCMFIIQATDQIG